MTTPVHVRPQRKVFLRRRIIGLYPYGGNAAASIGGVSPATTPDPAAPTDLLAKYAFKSVYAGQLSFIYTGQAGVNSTDRTFSVGAVSKQIASFRQDRRYFFILNIGANDAYVSIGRRAGNAQGVLLQSGQYWEPRVAPTSEVNAIGPSGATTLTVVEG